MDYGINIGVNVQSAQLKSLTRELKELRQIEQDLLQLKKEGAVADKDAARLRRQAKDQAAQLKKATLEQTKAFNFNGNAIKENVGKLREYTAELKDARSNFRKGSNEAKIFTDAITKADFTASIKGLKEFKRQAEDTNRALQLLMTGSGSSAQGVPRFGAFTGMKDLLEFQPANTTRGLADYSRVLEGVIGQVDIASTSYQELASRLREVNNLMAGIPIETMGPATVLDSPEAAAQRAEFQRQQRARRNRRLKGAAGGALLSGGFPLLFGQSTTAAIIGGAGGAIGGAMGGTFGFALGIVGTAIGEAIDKNTRFQKSLGDLNGAFSKAGSDSKFFAEDIDALAKSLRMTREEAMQLAGSFAFLGDAKMGENAAKLFGSPQLLRSIAQIKDSASLGKVLEDLLSEMSSDQIIQLGNEIRGLDVAKQRLIIEERLNKIKGKTVALTNEELRATSPAKFRRAARRSQKVTQFKTAIPASELGISNEQAVLEEFLRSFQDQPTGGSKADPTIMLRKRLEIVQAQVLAETDLISLQGKQSQAAKIILRQEMAIGKARAAAKADRAKFKDTEDQNLITLRETGEVLAANLKFERQALELAEKAVEQTKNIAKPLDDQLNAIKDKAAFEREYGELIMAGVIPAVAQQTVEINKQVKEIDRLKEKQSDELDFHILNLEALKAKAGTSELEAKIQEKINKLLERRLELEGKAKEAKDAARDAAKTPADRIEGEMRRVKGILSNLIDPANQVILAAEAIGAAFSESFKGLITGSMSAQEALANLFQRTADHFMDMAAQMIAKQIQMKILGIAFSFFNPAGGSTPGPGTTGVPGLEPNSYYGTGGRYGSFTPPKLNAAGGYISAPTSTLVGEGGQGEYVIPENKMRESMARYSRGARGASVIPETGGSGTSGESGGAAGAAPIDVRFTVERINSVDYVTADQFQAGMQRAADEGAKQGQQQTLKRLQMSSSTRKRLGM